MPTACSTDTPESSAPASTGSARRLRLALATRWTEIAEQMAEHAGTCGWDISLLPTDESGQDAGADPSGSDVLLVDFDLRTSSNQRLHHVLQQRWPACPLVLICSSEESPLAMEALENREVHGYIIGDLPMDPECVPTLIQQVSGIQEPRPEQPPSNADAEPSGKPRILVVDDNPLSCELAEWILIRNGFDAVSANTAEKAWRTLRADHFDAILMDVHLGHVNGIRLVAAIRSGCVCKNKHVPVIMVSADGTPSTVVSAAERSIQGYVVKPFSPAVLIDKINAVLKTAAKRAAV